MGARQDGPIQQQDRDSKAVEMHVVATLEVVTDTDGRKLYELTSDETIVGRNQFCDIILKSHTVSRQHARISRNPDGYFVEDLTSLNGTFVNRKRVEGRMPLRDQDRIDIYEVAMVFHEASPEEVEAQAGVDLLPVEEAPSPSLTDSRISRRGDSDLRLKDTPSGLGTTILSVDALAATVSDEDARDRLRAAFKIARDLAGSFDLDEMLPKILDSLFDIFPQADKGYVLIAEDGHLVPRAIKHRKADSGHSMTFGPISRKTAARVMSDGEALLMDDCGEDSGSVLDQKILSMICAPLASSESAPLGIIYVDTEDASARFNQDDLNVLITVAGVAGQAVQQAMEPAAEGTLPRAQVELDTAKQVQLKFLPQRRPQVQSYEFFDFYSSAQEIGGDYFGYIHLPDGRIAVAVGDVAGKGIPAALLMAHFSSQVRYRLATSKTPAEAVQRLNQDLSFEAASQHFITFVVCILDPRTHKLTVVNAGHMPPLLRQRTSRQVEELGRNESGLPLGCAVVRTYKSTEIALEPGDCVVLYTDGITEAMDVAGQIYTAGKLRQVLALAPPDVARMGEAVLNDVRQFTRGRTQSDDICLVCFSRLS